MKLFFNTVQTEPVYTCTARNATDYLIQVLDFPGLMQVFFIELC